MEAGVYQAVDPKSLEKLETEHQQKSNESNSKAQVWAKHKDEYKLLDEKLSTITDKTQYDVMVPFGGKKAFFEGQLVHTNEIMVLLGDNWFVERSAKEAREICKRRMNRCDEMLIEIDKEINLYQSWLREAQQLAHDSEKGEGNLEIREPYDPEEEAKWRIEHRERVRNEAMKKKDAPEEKEFDDDAFERRLDELEAEEALEGQLELEAEEEPEGQLDPEDKEESDLSQSPPLTDELEEEDIIAEIKSKLIMEQNTQEDKVTESNSKSVSFGDVSERLFSREQDNGLLKLETTCSNQLLQDNQTTIIEFSPSPVTSHEVHIIPDPGGIPNHPGDLIRLYGQVSSSVTSPKGPSTPKKSILKSDSKYGPLKSPGEDVKKKKKGVKMMSFADDPPASSGPKTAVMPSKKSPIQAVSDVVIEREPTHQPQSNGNKSSDDNCEVSKTAPVTQVFSRFRATRVHQ